MENISDRRTKETVFFVNEWKDAYEENVKTERTVLFFGSKEDGKTVPTGRKQKKLSAWSDKCVQAFAKGSV